MKRSRSGEPGQPSGADLAGNAVCPFDPRTPPDDPWASLAALRSNGPTAHFPDADLYATLGYETTRDAFAAPERFSSRYNIKPDGDYSIVSSDPPEHTRQRRILNRVLTPQRVARLEPRVQTITDRIVDDLPDRGPVDIVANLAFLLPVTVLAELLGVPDADRARFKMWSDEQLSQSLGAGTSSLAQEFKHWALGQIEERRRAGGPDDDLIGRLALTDVDGERLTAWEAASTLVLLVVAGHETTTNAIASTVRLLVEQPGLVERLRADRAQVCAFVEESLRLDPPVTALPRKTRAAVSIGDATIPEGEIVLLHMGAANRDPDFVREPDRCVLDRDLPGPHLAFGFGIHLCLGAALARAELRISVETLLNRLTGLRAVEAQEVRQTPAYIFRGPQRYLIDYDHREPRRG